MRKTDLEDFEYMRTNRMFQREGAWYFYTREEAEIGPFADEGEAVAQLEVYIRLANAGLLPPGASFEIESVVMDRAV